MFWKSNDLTWKNKQERRIVTTALWIALKLSANWPVPSVDTKSTTKSETEYWDINLSSYSTI
jgi:hypothetical protein